MSIGRQTRKAAIHRVTDPRHVLWDCVDESKNEKFRGGWGYEKAVAHSGDGFTETQQSSYKKSVCNAAAVWLVLGVCDLFAGDDGIKGICKRGSALSISAALVEALESMAPE
jgi:hypothetical protein